jgi:hypothetical protein
MKITDSWGNSISGTYTLTIVSLPVITSLSQNSAPYGSCLILTITGQNFANSDTAEFVAKGTSLGMETTFVSSTQLTAQLLPFTVGAGTFQIHVLKAGSGFASPPFSNAVPFALLAQSITGLVRSFGTAGAAAGTQMIVNGSNFASPGNAGCSTPGSTVIFGGTASSREATNTGWCSDRRVPRIQAQKHGRTTP